MSKRLILIRHGHRDTSDRDRDNGLDDKGKKQARRIVKYYLERFGEERSKIYSSRLTRCMQTVEPLAAELGTKVEISPYLIERWKDKSNETEKEFKNRVETFCDEWKKSRASLTIACSHGDWIPEAMKHLVGMYSDLSKGGWAEIEMTEDGPTLQFLLQKLV